MPLYSFEGRREKTGELIKGSREATSYLSLGQDLLSEGILLTNYHEQQQTTKKSFTARLLGRVPAIERVLFTRYFSLMLKAGLDVKRSLSTLGEQTTNRSLRTALGVIYRDIERGKTLAESMNAFPAIFPALFVSFIRVGETTGRLQETLHVLAEQLQKEYDLRRTVRGAMIYPAVIVVALIAVAMTMLIFVVPQLAEVFTGFKAELPLSTRILLVIGTFFGHYWYLALLGLLGGVSGAVVLLRMVAVRRALARGYLFVPVIKPIMIKINLARFSRNLSALIYSGMGFTEALKVLSETTPHPDYALVFAKAQEHVKQGKPLSDFLAGYTRLFPPLISRVVRVGEETGQLNTVLAEIALFYESDVDQTMKNLASIIEPVLMVIIGLAVGALAVSIISPIYSLVNVI